MYQTDLLPIGNIHKLTYTHMERAKQLSFQHIENQRMAIMRSIEAEDAERERAEKEKSRGHR